MTDDPISDPVSNAAARSKLRRTALTTTAGLLRRRIDPRLIAADIAKVVLARSIARIAAIPVTPKQRKRALAAGAVAAVAGIALRVLYRNAREKKIAAPSPDTGLDVKRLP